jgi:Asp-tRNA(Asn)/Glu-tRNA(Gln) amidotransferase A subunit family amidase
VGLVGRRLRIRFTTRSTLVNAEPEIASAVERAASLLERAGHHVEEGETARGTSRDEFLPLWQAAIAAAPVRRWDRTEPVTQWLGQPGRQLKSQDVASLAARITGNVLDWFGDVDAWLVPTVAVAPPRIGAWQGFGPREIYEAAAEIAAFTAPINVTGQPAVSVPAGVSSRRHPIGVQLVGRPRADAELFTLAAELESLLSQNN